MPDSFQELMIHAETAHSLGAPYLFAPARYSKKPNSIRNQQPADLAWVCNGSVFLFGETSGKKPYSYQVEHNVNQLIGFARKWSDGHILKGTNKWQKFRLTPHDANNIFLISVVNAQNARAEFHTAYTARGRKHLGEKLAGVATVPESILLKMVKMGASAADLANFMGRLASSPSMSEAAALELLADHHEQSIAEAAISARIPLDRDDALDEFVFNEFLAVIRRLQALKLNGNDLDGIRGLGIFNDLTWQQTSTLVFAVSDSVRMVCGLRPGTLGSSSRVEVLTIGSYRFIVGSADLQNTDKLAEAIERAASQLAGAGFAIVGLLPNQRPRPDWLKPLLAFREQIVTTNVEQAMIEIRAAVAATESIPSPRRQAPMSAQPLK